MDRPRKPDFAILDEAELREAVAPILEHERFRGWVYSGWLEVPLSEDEYERLRMAFVAPYCNDGCDHLAGEEHNWKPKPEKSLDR